MDALDTFTGMRSRLHIAHPEIADNSLIAAILTLAQLTPQPDPIVWTYTTDGDIDQSNDT